MNGTFRPAWDIDRVYETIRRVAEEIPDRLPGTEAAARMAAFSREELERAGVPAAVHAVDALVSIPKPARLKLLDPVAQDIPALTMAHSPNTAAPVEGALIDVGLGAWDDYAGRDVAGAVTLSELSYAPPRQEKQRIAGVKGCSAQIMMNWGYDEGEELPMGSVKSGWGNPTRADLPVAEASLPCLGISRKDGLLLRRLCADGPVQVRLETIADTGWRPIHVTIGELASAAGEDFVLVGGHQDGWYGAAATDNAAGSAIIIELARAFAAQRDSLRRGFVFGLWAGHETGTMAGSAWWADRNWDRLRDRAVAYLQIDQPACAGTSGWTVTSNHELVDLAQQVHDARGEAAALSWAPQVKNGDSSFFGLGLPMMVAHSQFPREELERSSNAAYGWWHHTDRNDLDKVDRSQIAGHLDAYAAYLGRLAMDPVLPLRFSALAAAIDSRLAALAAQVREDAFDLAALRGAAARLREELAALDRTADRLAAEGTRDESAVGALNDVLKRLSRILIPVVSTVAGKYGHDVYGLTEQTTLLPGLYHLESYAASNQPDERAMLWVELIRARNRVSDALSDALAAARTVAAA